MKTALQKKKMLGIWAIFLVCVMALVFIAQIDWKKIFAEDYSADYMQLSDQTLDELTYRDSVSDDLPQMTVFTHGLGGSGAHFSSKNSDGKGFDYEEGSMIEQLRDQIEASGEEALVISVSTGYSVYNSLGMAQTIGESRSVHAGDENINALSAQAVNDDGAATFRASYVNYKPDKKVDRITENSGKEEYVLEKNSAGLMNAFGIENIPEDKLTQDGFRKVSLYKLNKNNYSKSSNYIIQSGDTDKHWIVVFEQNSLEQEIDENNIDRFAKESNDYVYAQYEYCLDVLSYMYCQLSGKLPTMNLIGYSRGGITTMQYALGHPYNVASMYAMGSPYNGSELGSFKVGDVHPGLLLANYNRDYAYKDKNDFEPGVLDILDNDLSESYKTYWNNHYEECYYHIAFKPIGSYVTGGFILQVLADALTSMVLSKIIDNEIILKKIDRVLSSYARQLELRADFVFFLAPNSITRKLNVLKGYFQDTVIYPYLCAITKVDMTGIPYLHIGKYTTSPCVIKDDLFIDLDSQTAYGYKGRDVRVKLFQSWEQDGGKSANAVGVAHNLETHNQDIIDYIVHDLNFGASEGIFSVRYTAEGCYITNLNNSSAQGELVIPETYNGYTVIGVDGLTRDLDMSGSQTYHTGITSVKIPSTVKEIGDFAFFGMSNLLSVTYAGQNNIEAIGGFAFGNCVRLANFEIGAKVSFIGEAAFSGCDSLTSFSLKSGNSEFLCNDGVLYSGDGLALNAFPAGRGGSFTVPNSVKLIAAGAFYGNNKLTSVHLNQADSVSDCAFADCTNLSEITAPNLRSAGIGAFENTHWLNNATDEFVSVGGVLIKYQGNDNVLRLSGYSSINAFAFADCTNLQEVDFDGNELSHIGAWAFSGCTNLSKVTIRNSERMVGVVSPIFDADSTCAVDVPSTFIGDYKADDIWCIYKDQIRDLLVTIQFVDGGVVQGYTKEIKIGNPLTDMPVPQKEGYEFLGWFTAPNGGGQKYENGSIYLNTSDFTLYAAWRVIPYAIIYDMDGGTNHAENPSEYTIEQTVLLNAPNKTGYTFIGWELDGAMLAGNQISGKTGNLHLKAIWEAKSIAVGFDSKGSKDYPASSVGLAHVTYGTDDFCLEIPERIGFKFLGWYYNGIAFTDANGNAVRKWDLSDNTILYAVWEAESFKIRYDAETESIYFSGSAWTDEEVEVTVGMQLTNENIVEESFQQYYKIQDKIIRYFYYFTPNGDKVTFRLSSTSMPFLESINGTVEFFAEYRLEEHTMFFVTNVQGQSFSSIKADSGSNIANELKNRIPSRNGYTFGGWKVTAAPDNTLLEGIILGSIMPDCSSTQLDSSCMVEAIWNPISVAIELDPNGGSSVSTYQAIFGEDYKLPVPIRAGYSFNGWYNINGKQYTLSTGESLDVLKETELEVIAQWTIIRYSITYVLNGGQNNSSNPSSYTVASPVTLLTPHRTGYRFMGWYRDSAYNNQITKITGTGNLTIYAKWTKLYTIKIIGGDGSVVKALTGIYNETLTLPTYRKTGFDGKYRDKHDGKSYAFGDKYIVQLDTELSIIWTSNDLKGSYTVRTTQVTITDNGRWTNQIDSVKLTNFSGGLSVSQLKAKGYVRLKLKITIDIAEKNDGYQYIMIYDENNESTATQLDGVTIEHGPGKEDNNFKTYSYNFTINISEIKSNYIYLLYGASGVGNDDWYNKNVKVEGTFTKIS